MIDYSLGRGQIRPIGHLVDYETFLYNIIKFNTNLGRICFCFSRVLGGVIMALEESFMFVACLHKQIPFGFILVEIYK